MLRSAAGHNAFQERDHHVGLSGQRPLDGQPVDRALTTVDVVLVWRVQEGQRVHAIKPRAVGEGVGRRRGFVAREVGVGVARSDAVDLDKGVSPVELEEAVEPEECRGSASAAGAAVAAPC